MEIKLSELFGAQEALHVLDEAKNLPAKIKYRISKVVEQLEKEARDVEKRRIEILERLGCMPVEEEEHGRKQVVRYEFLNLEKTKAHCSDVDEALFLETAKREAEERKKSFEDEYKELMDEVVDIHVMKISLDDFEKVPEFTAKHMRQAFWLIDESEEK